jgi:hypothetical protein
MAITMQTVPKNLVRRLITVSDFEASSFVTLRKAGAIINEARP